MVSRAMTNLIYTNSVGPYEVSVYAGEPHSWIAAFVITFVGLIGLGWWMIQRGRRR